MRLENSENVSLSKIYPFRSLCVFALNKNFSNHKSRLLSEKREENGEFIKS